MKRIDEFITFCPTPFRDMIHTEITPYNTFREVTHMAASRRVSPISEMARQGENCAHFVRSSRAVRATELRCFSPCHLHLRNGRSVRLLAGGGADRGLSV
jgi:hypothetical protein